MKDVGNAPVTRATAGGHEARFVVRRADGSPIPADRRYFVLSFDGSDPQGVDALKYYAFLMRAVNRELSRELLANIGDPAGAPPQHEGGA